MREFKHRPYGPTAVEWITDNKRSALWAGMGMGKTSICLSALHTWHCMLGVEEPTLVIAPKRVAQSTWPNEVREWSDFADLRIQSLVGEAAERKAALRKPAHVHTINYDNLPWLVETWGVSWPYRWVIADESTKLKGFRLRQGGKRAQALAQVAHSKCERFTELTGTPSPNGLQDLWGQAWFLDEGQRLGRTFTSFRGRWFRPVSAGGDYFNWVPTERAQPEIMERMSDLALTLDPKDWFDLKDPIVSIIKVELEPSARRKYDEFERELFLELQEGEVEAVSAAAKSMKCLQLANGAVYLDPDRYGKDMWAETSYAKLEALESIVNEAAGMPVLVAYQFKSDLARILRAFPKARHLDADPRTVDDWNAGRIPILCAHPASAGHGLNLQHGGNILVFFGHWWDLEQHDQIVERIGPVRQAQSGYDRATFIHYIVAHDTVDEVVIARRAGKADVQRVLLDYMKGKKR